MINIVLIISFILEGILSLFIPYIPYKLNFLYPHLVLICIIFLYQYYKDKNKYYLILLLIGILYDLIYTDVLFLHSFLFLIIGIFIKQYNKRIGITKKNLLILVFMEILLYDSLYSLLLVLFQNMDFSLIEVLYKVLNSYIINVLYAYILYKLFPIKKKKHKKAI